MGIISRASVRRGILPKALAFAAVLVLLLGSPASALIYQYYQQDGSFEHYYYYGRTAQWTNTAVTPGPYAPPLPFPYSAVGKLFIATGDDPTDFDSSCTAWLINSPSHDMIATAGHCVSRGDGTYYKMFYFAPSYDGTGANTDSDWCLPSAVETTPTFLNYGSWEKYANPDPHDDFAVLRVNCLFHDDPVDYYGAFGFAFNLNQAPEYFGPYQTETAGYPNNIAQGEQMISQVTQAVDIQSFGASTSDGEQSPQYHVGSDFGKGSSGSPFFTQGDDIAFSVISLNVPGETNYVDFPWLGPKSLRIYYDIRNGGAGGWTAPSTARSFPNAAQERAAKPMPLLSSKRSTVKTSPARKPTSIISGPASVVIPAQRPVR